MKGPIYRAPPIIEAVIEVRFDAASDYEVVQTAAGVIGRNYREKSGWVRSDINAQVQADGQIASVGMRQGNRGIKLSTLDVGEIAIPNQHSFVVSQVPDYPGWEALFTRFSRDWALWKQAVGYSKVAQVGLRYINRLDIPIVNTPLIRIEKYVTLYAEVPEALGPTITNSVQAITELPELKGQIALNSGVVRSPVPDAFSILLDISVSVAIDPPQRDDDLLALLQRLRVEKNRAFELCITNHARELFK